MRDSQALRADVVTKQKYSNRDVIKYWTRTKEKAKQQ